MQLPRGRERRIDLRRVVRVVVVDRRRRAAAPRSSSLRPAPGSRASTPSGVLPRRRRRARAPRGRPPRSAGCARRQRQARTRPAPARRLARPSRQPSSQRSKSASTSARDVNVEWWSRSTFVSTPISGRSSSSDRSDSSPSATSQPLPRPAFPPSCGTGPPTRNVGSSPRRSRRQNAIIAAVVVLPCAPATTIDGRSRDELGKQLTARLRPATGAGDTPSRRPAPSHPAADGRLG